MKFSTVVGVVDLGCRLKEIDEFSEASDPVPNGAYLSVELTAILPSESSSEQVKRPTDRSNAIFRLSLRLSRS